MMGLPTTSSVDTNATYATSNPYIGWFGQDNWRVNPKLTLNLGLRMEYEFGIKERYNRLIAGFDPTASLPITALAQAAYAKNPVPGTGGIGVCRDGRFAVYRSERCGRALSRQDS